MASREEDERRYPRNLQGVMQFALNHSDDPTNSSSSAFQEMSKERREWLQEALSSIAEDTDVKRMMKYLQILEKPCDTNNADDDLGEKEDAFEELSMIVEDLDNANDFHKIGGYQVMIKCLSSEHSSLRWRAADILAVCVQNNPYCQKAAMEMNILPTLTSLLETDQLDQVRIKALYAISGLTRNSPKAEEAFLKDDGVSMLFRTMQAENEKLITKSAFMTRNLLMTNPTLKETLFKMGLTEQLVGLLRGPQNSSRAHVINLFKTFVMDYPPAINECQRPEFDLERLLSSIITSSMEDDPDAHEDMILNCKELLNICFKK